MKREGKFMGKVNITDKVMISIDSKTYTLTDYKLLKPANAMMPGEMIIYDNQGEILTYLERTEATPTQQKQEKAPAAEPKKDQPKEPPICPRCGADLGKQAIFKSQKTGAELCKKCFDEESRVLEEKKKLEDGIPEKDPLKTITIEWFDIKSGSHHTAKKQCRSIEECIEFIKSV